MKIFGGRQQLAWIELAKLNLFSIESIASTTGGKGSKARTLAIDGATVYWEGQKTRSKQSKKRKQRRLKNDKELSRPKRRKKEAGSAGVQEGPMKAAAGAVEEAQYSDQVEVSGTDAMAVELSGRWHDELVA